MGLNYDLSRLNSKHENRFRNITNTFENIHFMRSKNQL